MLVIGITGGIATGKSVAAAHFEEKYGAVAIDADKIGHALLKTKEAPAFQEVVAYFGEAILDSEGNVDRKKLGERVFRCESDLKALNRMLHPPIKDEIDNRIKELEANDVKQATISNALFLETGFYRDFPKIIVILSDPKIQYKRLLEKRSMTDDEAKLRLKNQFSNEERLEIIKSNSLVEIWNNKDLASFKRSLDEAWKRLTLALD